MRNPPATGTIKPAALFRKVRKNGTGAMIDVKKLDDGVFSVTVTDQMETTHEVTVDRAHWEELTGGDVSMETLIERSFEFLLEREPNTSILPSFNVSTIKRYFPEYEDEIRKRV